MNYTNIRYNISYRDNPLNRYHDTYQSMVNRVFCVFLFCIFELAMWSTFGFSSVLFIGLVYFILLALSAIFEIVVDVIQWVFGY